jgi:hypothetical protein
VSSLVGDADSGTWFDGTDDTVNFSDVYDFTGTGSSTVELRINPTAATAANRRVTAKQAATGGWALYLEWAGAIGNQISFVRRTAASADTFTNSTTMLQAGIWLSRRRHL